MKVKANLKFKVSFCCLLGVTACSGFSQDFQNLDFNSANIPSGTGQISFLPIADAIPGWTGFIGNNEVTDVLYDGIAIGSAAIVIVDASTQNGGNIPGNNYTVILQAGNDGGDAGRPNATASLAQTALIPSTAQSIEFTASIPYGAGWQISINGQPIAVSQIGTVNSYYGVFAGNVSAYAGEVDQLEFTALYADYPGDLNEATNLNLDSISFSAAPVPEANSFGLFALGGLFVAWRHWRKSLP
jgi:hypothetical protein